MDDPATRRAKTNIAKDGPTGIVVGLDGSAPSRDALAYAAGLARRNHSWLVVVFVSQTAVLASLTPEAVAVTTQLSSEEAGRLAEEVHSIDETGVDWEFLHGHGDPARELEQVAEDRKADSIVIGRSSSRAHAFIGSVPIRLVRISRRPTIVVP